MSTLIAVAGKGGTGKTTLASLIIREFTQKTHSLLAIDADPNNNFGGLLGLKQGETIMDIVEEISKNKDTMPQGMTKQRYIDFKIQESIEESERFDLLSMGRPEGPGCYCYANNLLRDIIERIAKNYEFIVVDNEAGMEHLSRRLMRRIDSLFITSDFSIIGVRSARRISELTDSLDIKVSKKMLVLNKVKGNIGLLQDEISNTGIKPAAFIPYDEGLEKISLKGASIFELKDTSPAVMAMSEILRKEKSWIC